MISTPTLANTVASQVSPKATATNVTQATSAITAGQAGKAIAQPNPGLNPGGQVSTNKPTTLLSLINQGVINKLSPTLAQVSQIAKASPQQLARLQQLSPQLLNISSSHFLLRLNVQGQQLLAHSPIPFSAGQSVALKLNAHEQLQIKPAKAQQASLKLPNSSSQKLNNTQLGQIQTALRQVLPQQTSSKQALNSLLQLSKLPEGSQKLLLSPPLRHTSEVLLKGAPILQQLSKGPELKQAISGSGFNQESQIKNLLKGSSEQGLEKPINLANTKTQLARLSQLLIQELKLASPETKFDSAIVGLAKQLLGQTLPQAERPTTQMPGELEKALDQLLKAKLNHAGQSQSNNQLNRLSEPQLLQLRNFLQRQLLQQTLGGLAKIQTQQLQGMSDQASNPSLLNRWLIELPFIDQHHVQTIAIDIQEHQPKHQEQKDEPELKSVWQVKLSLELEQTGPLHAEIKLLGSSSEITLWFEQPEGLKKGKQYLQQLRQNIEDQGIEVNGLQCLSGCPPQSGSGLHHNLINTKV